MYKKVEVELIYITEQQSDDDIVESVIIKGDLGDVYSNKYYSAKNNDIELSCVLRIREHYNVQTNDKSLRFVKIKGVQYIIEKVSQLKGRFILLDLSEDI